jgi:hypothetical protein
MKRRIEWEAWVYPYKKEWEKQTLSEAEGEVVFAGRWQDSYEKEEEKNENEYIPVVPGPTGAYPINITHDFSSLQFWIGNTNFFIDDEVKDILDSTLGVKILDVFDPHTFRISVAKLFESADVKSRIQERLNAVPEPKGILNPGKIVIIPELRKIVADYKEQCEASESKLWLLLVFPNCQMESFSTNSKDEFEQRLEFFRRVQENTNAIIFTTGF